MTNTPWQQACKFPHFKAWEHFSANVNFWAAQSEHGLTIGEQYTLIHVLDHRQWTFSPQQFHTHIRVHTQILPWGCRKSCHFVAARLRNRLSLRHLAGCYQHAYLLIRGPFAQLTGLSGLWQVGTLPKCLSAQNVTFNTGPLRYGLQISAMSLMGCDYTQLAFFF